MKKSTPLDFTEARLNARMDTKALCRYLNINERTIRRWQQDGAQIAVVLLLDVIGGHIGKVLPDWDGWLIKGDAVICPQNQQASQGEIRALFWQYQRIRTLTSELRRLRQTDKAAPAKEQAEPEQTEAPSVQDNIIKLFK